MCNCLARSRQSSPPRRAVNCVACPVALDVERAATRWVWRVAAMRADPRPGKVAWRRPNVHVRAIDKSERGRAMDHAQSRAARERLRGGAAMAFLPIIRPWDESHHGVRWLQRFAFACAVAHELRRRAKNTLSRVPSFPRRERTVPGVRCWAVSESQRGWFGKSLVRGARAPVQHDQRQ